MKNLTEARKRTKFRNIAIEKEFKIGLTRGVYSILAG